MGRFFISTRVYQTVLTLGVLQTGALDLPIQCQGKSCVKLHKKLVVVIGAGLKAFDFSAEVRVRKLFEMP